MQVVKRVLVIADVPTWAWGIKSRYLKRHLSDEFVLHLYYLDMDRKRRIPDSYDLYLTFHPSHLRYLTHIPRRKKISGVTGVDCFPKWVEGKTFDSEVAALHANSTGLLRMLQGKHKRLYYVPNGVDCSLFTPEKFKERPFIVVGFVGKNSKVKGLNVARAAVQACEKVRFEPKITNWKEAVPLQNLPKYYAGIDVYIVTSEAEGTPNPALEAAACGRPLLVSAVGNMPEFIVDGVNGFLLKDREVLGYVEKLKFFRAHREQMKLMGEAARKTALKWEWKVQVENYRKMFREVLEK